MWCFMSVASDSEISKEIYKEVQVVVDWTLYFETSKMNFNTVRTLECIRKHFFPQGKIAKTNKKCDIKHNWMLPNFM